MFLKAFKLDIFSQKFTCRHIETLYKKENCLYLCKIGLQFLCSCLSFILLQDRGDWTLSCPFILRFVNFTAMIGLTQESDFLSLFRILNSELFFSYNVSRATVFDVYRLPILFGYPKRKKKQLIYNKLVKLHKSVILTWIPVSC